MLQTLKVEKSSQATVTVIPLRQKDDELLYREFLNTFAQYEKAAGRRMVVDLHQMRRLSPDFIALLVELAGRSRRRGSEFKVVRVQPTALEDLLTFNSKAYMGAEILGAAAENETVGGTVAAPGTGRSKGLDRIELPYEEEAIYLATDRVSRQAEMMGFSASEISRMKIAVYEACLNAIQHTRTARAQGKIIVEVESVEDALEVRVIDFGRGFDVKETKEFDPEEAAKKGRIGGMGLHIIRRAMDVVDYQKDSVNGNTLRMIKYRDSKTR